MSAPTAAVDICNLALHHVGERAINSIEAPTTDNEETLALWYDHTRQTLLRDYVWNCAQKYTVLARAGDGEGSYDDAYNLPNDFIRLNSVGEDITDPITDYELGEGVIYASEGDELPIRYNRNITNVNSFDALFIDCLALAIAENIAFKITKKKSVSDLMAQKLAMRLPKATSVDGQERPPRRVERSKYLTARRFGGSINRDNRYYEYD
jgi:hypothetical protein